MLLQVIKMESISRQDAKELEEGIVLIHKRLERRKLRMIHSRSHHINSNERPSKTNCL